MPKVKPIYLDYAAATPLDPTVERVILKYTKVFGNPSSLHGFGQAAKAILDQSRTKIGRVLNCRPEELVFTGSGTEADNLAILGVARARLHGAHVGHGPHVITTQIEHHAVLRACEQLEREGFKVTYLPVDGNGFIKPEQVVAAIRPNTILISIGYANNEIGTIQPIKEISKALHQLKTINCKLKTVLHSDASAAAGYLNLNIQELGVDLLTINAAKIYGPKGVGCLFVRRGVELAPIIFGGNQEGGRRAGTESPALIAGLTEALTISEKKRVRESARQTKLRDWLIAELLKIPGTRLNGDAKLRLPNNINISLKGMDGERLVLDLDHAGIAVSTGSACTAKETGRSYVLKAMEAPKDWGNLRVTLGRETSEAELKYFLVALKKLSPR
ncbi:MAG TPA: cysteine desulfurase family protein [Candidatus Paceibacterota bacterium]|nr:cysteine desulfurase family protein [Candidatus Paceibacterota bacterium]